MQDRIQIHLVINKYLNDILENLSNTLGRTKSDLMKEAIILLANKYEYFLNEKETPETRIMKAITKLNREFKEF